MLASGKAVKLPHGGDKIGKFRLGVAVGRQQPLLQLRVVHGKKRLET
jgi:hypothetical protein